ncbi:MAG: potassium channel family protein [Candidatus Binatia bacterium]
MAGSRHSFLISARPGHYTGMVLMLMVYVLVSPFTTIGSTANRVLNLAVVLTLLSVVRASWPSLRMMVPAAGLALAALLPTLGLLTDAGLGELTSHAASMAFILLVMGAILSQVLTTEYVTLDTVVGAASVYLLIGLLFGALYAVLEYWTPGSFAMPATFQPTGPTSLAPLMKDTIILYYSFETLTTLGYGDVTPATPPARFFSITEALVGQLYLAILVARFVGLQVTHSTRRRE